MAFQVAPADIPIHRSHRQSAEAKHPLRIGPHGPVVAFQGPDDWANFEVTPPEWGHRFSDDPVVQYRGTAARALSNGFGRIPLAVNAQGQVGYDLDWILLVALTSDHLQIGHFRTLLERPGCDPGVAFPNTAGPGGGQPLPFAILNSRRTPEEKMRLLDCLPRETLALQHAGQSLTEVAYARLQHDKEPSLAAHVLFVWVQTASGQPFPEGAFRNGLPALTSRNSDETKQVATMLASKPLAAALGAHMDVKKGGGRGGMEEKLKTYLRIAPLQQATLANAPTAPVRSRRMRS